MYKFLVLILLVVLLSPLVAAQGKNKDERRFEIFGGYSGARNSDYGYLGVVGSINGDLTHDGWLLRASGGYGEFDYDRPRNKNGDVTDRFTGVDLMVGYQKFFDPGVKGVHHGRFTIYVGGDYQDHDLDKRDRLNPVEGSETGVKGLAELNLDFSNHLGFYGAGSYSSANNTYWGRLRPGYNAKHFIIGPEVTFLGSEAFDQQRYGAYIANIAISNSVKAEINAGYSDAARRGKDGMYGGVGLAVFF